MTGIASFFVMVSALIPIERIGGDRAVNEPNAIVA
jgi:hypothetical protein